MIEIELRLYGNLRRFLIGKKIGEAHSMQLEEDSTVEDVMTSLKIPHDDIKIIIINGRPKKIEDTLSNNDRVAIFPAIAGG